MDLQKLLQKNNPSELKSFFAFDDQEAKLVLARFDIWARKYFGKYFTSDDAPFHKEIDTYNLQVYRGEIPSFTDIAFRGAAKTARTKLFIAFCILNDKNHFRKYIKILSEDATNSKQIVTDIYNMLVHVEFHAIYPEVFRKTQHKREETMSSFTTATGIKLVAGTVGTDQRGALQEEARPDFIWFEDFENRITVRSAVKTKSIWDNMEEARTGLAKGGSCLYTCNYISEAGNVHKLVLKKDERHIVLIVPIIRNGIPTWDRYSIEEINQMREDDEDFEGERLCEPSAGRDIYFDRRMIDTMEKLEPYREVSGFRMYKKYDSGHRYAGGHDVAGGVGLDSSTSVFIDFDTIPAQVVATYDDNTIKEDIFGDEIKSQGDRYGECLLAPERNNYGSGTIGRLKQIYNTRQIFKTQPKETKIISGGKKPINEYGWHTNALTKPKILGDLKKAVNDGLLVLNCPRLIAEARSFTRNDFMDSEPDPRLTTRHFDLLIACAIAWQMKNYVDISEKKKEELDEWDKMIANTDFDPYDPI